MKSQHIVQVSAYYPPHLGGQENAVHDLAQQLAGAGHSVEVLTSAVGAQAAGYAQEQNVRVQRFPGFVFGHAPVMIRFPLALWRTAHRHSVVHLHIGQAFTPEIVWLVSKLRRFTFVAHLHIDFEPSGPAGFLLPLYKRLVLKRVLQAAHAVVALNQQTLATLQDFYQCADKAQIVPNGINEMYFAVKRPAQQSAPPKQLRLLFVGRLSKQKNVTMLLEALARTKRQVVLDIIGEGEQRAAIEAAIKRLGLTGVRLHGRLDRPRVMEFYATSDALIMPSFYEAQPLVLLEALAARIPIIGTDVIGVAEHIQGAGIIVPPTVEGIVAGIEQYYQTYKQLPGLAQNGFARVTQLRWKHLLKQYEALYAEVSQA